MPTPKDWISAMRLRTLPLAASTVLAGAASAFNYGKFSWLTFTLILLTTLFLQILSNLANDLGDAIKGTDDENRLGPTRSIQSGAITKSEMKRMTIIFAVMSFLLGLAAIYSAFESIHVQTILFIILGIAAIAAAMKYTLGKNPYGYSGLGDVFVFLFFGLVGVVGTDYLLSGEFHIQTIFVSFTVGVLSVAVLNLNNMRDIKNDRNHNKRTIVVILGLEQAKRFHSFLILSSFVSMMIYFTVINNTSWTCLFTILILFRLVPHWKFVKEVEDERELNPELKKVALITFATFLIFFTSRFVQVYELF